MNLEKFIPSKKLVNIIIENMVQPDKETLEAFEELKQFHTEFLKESSEPDVKVDFANKISEHIEGLFANLSRKRLKTGKPLQLSNGWRFTPNICTRLIDYLDQDAFNPIEVLSRLHDELYEFVSITKRMRNWGEIVIDNSKLKIIPIDDTSDISDLDRIGKEHWVAHD